MNRLLPKTATKMFTAPLLRAPITTNADYYRAEGRPLNIAHRGLAGLIPENTIPAFEAALYSGADFVELDVVYTKDNRLLVMHDPYLHRITNAMVDEFPYAYEERYYASDNKTYNTLCWREIHPLIAPTYGSHQLHTTIQNDRGRTRLLRHTPKHPQQIKVKRGLSPQYLPTIAKIQGI